MNAALLPRVAGLQLLFVGALFAVLAVTVPHSFFTDYGVAVGPLAWIVCSLATGRLLGISVARLALASVAGGITAGLVGVVVDHVVSLPVAIGVFAAVCAAEPRGGTRRRRRSAPERA